MPRQLEECLFDWVSFLSPRFHVLLPLAFAGTKISLSTAWQPSFLKPWSTSDKTSLFGKCRLRVAGLAEAVTTVDKGAQKAARREMVFWGKDGGGH